MTDPIQAARALLDMKYEPNTRALQSALADLVAEAERLREAAPPSDVLATIDSLVGLASRLPYEQRDGIGAMRLHDVDVWVRKAAEAVLPVDKD